MKKLIIILLVGMLCLGLSGIAFADTQNIGAKIGGTVSLTVPTELTSDEWVMTYTAGGGTTQDNTKENSSSSTTVNDYTAKVEANCPYQLKVKVDSAAYPDTADAYMSNSTTSEDLTIPLKLTYDSGNSNVTSYDSAEMSYYTKAAITTGDLVFYDEPLVPDDGIDYIAITYNQELVITDPAYTATGTQVIYQIKLMWSVSTVIS